MSPSPKLQGIVEKSDWTADQNNELIWFNMYTPLNIKQITRTYL